MNEITLLQILSDATPFTILAIILIALLYGMYKIADKAGPAIDKVTGLIDAQRVGWEAMVERQNITYKLLVDDLRVDIQRLQQKVSELECRLAEKEKELAEAKQRISELETELNTVKHDRELVAIERDALKKKVEELTEEVQRLSKELGEARQQLSRRQRAGAETPRAVTRSDGGAQES